MSDVLSMTGYAISQGETDLGLVTVEIRCVNSRFLDLTLRICDELHALEPYKIRFMKHFRVPLR